MSKDKSSLGTGLDSLLGDRPKTDPQGIKEIATEDLSPGQYQPRKKMYKSTLEELAQSIKEQGILQPLVEEDRPLVGLKLWWERGAGALLKWQAYLKFLQWLET